MADLEAMTRDELLALLRARQAEEERHDQGVMHDLRVHQIELEMQNRELREAQQVLEFSRARYADLYDLAPVGYCTLDAQGKVLEINLTASTMLGVERAKMLGRPLPRALDGEAAQKIQAHLRRCAWGDRAVASEVTLKPAHGPRMVVQLNSVPSGSPEGATVYRTVLTDVTALHEARASLRWLCDAGERLGGLLDADSVVSAAANLVVPSLADFCEVHLLDAGGEARSVTRRGPTETRGNVSHPRELLGLQDLVREALSTGSTQLRASETARSAPLARSVLVAPLLSRGQSLGALALVGVAPRRGYSHDDLRLAEEFASRAALALEHARLRQSAHASAESARRERASAVEAGRTRDRFLTVVSRELGAPLASIVGWSQMLRGGRVAHDRWGQALGAIEHSAGSHAQLIRDLLDVTRVDRAALGLVCAPMHLGPVVDAAVEATRAQAAAREVRVEVEVSPALALVEADAARMRQVAATLLAHAIASTPREGAVRLTLRNHGGRVALAVRDGGESVAPELLSTAFERFWQAESDDEGARAGSFRASLGLALVGQVVEAHGGSVRAYCESVGGGSTFEALLPAADLDRVSAPSVKPAPSAPLAHVRALVVDPDDATREEAVTALEAAGAEVTTARSSQEALAEAARALPSVVVLNLAMHGDESAALLAALRAIPEGGATVPVVALRAPIDPRRLIDEVSRRVVATA